MSFAALYHNSNLDVQGISFNDNSVDKRISDKIRNVKDIKCKQSSGREEHTRFKFTEDNIWIICDGLFKNN